MSSLSDIQQIYALLQAIDELLNNIDGKLDTVEKKATVTTASLRQFEQILIRSLILTRRLGLSDDLSDGAAQIQRTILLVYQLNSALAALSAASMANPVGLVLAVTGIAITAFNVADSVSYESRG